MNIEHPLSIRGSVDRHALEGVALFNATHQGQTRIIVAEDFLTEIARPETSDVRAWHALLDKLQDGLPASARAVAALEDAVVRNSDVVTLLQEQAALLLPTQRLRLAIRVWDRATAAQRGVLREIMLENLHVVLGDKSPVSVAPPGLLTTAQRTALNRLQQLAAAFFAGAGADQPIRPRYQPLIAGPSGVGKTELGRKLAASCSATFLKLSIGEWIPMSAKAEPWTLFRILDACAASERVVLFIDELDKQQGGFSTGWSQSVIAEVFSVLDGDHPFDSYMEKRRGLDRDLVQSRVRRGLFKMGAGTWHSEWAKPPALGFFREAADQPHERIVKQPSIPQELLLRFALPLLVLQYPSPTETAELFEQAGLIQLANLAGVQLDVQNHDWRHGGLRTMENLAADLWLKIRQGRDQ